MKPESLYKFYSLNDEYSLLNLLKNQVYFSNSLNFDDSNDCVILGVNANILVSCFTSVVNDYMWENFGGEHNGFCVEYDVNCLTSKLGDGLKVKYHKPDYITNLKFEFGRRLVENNFPSEEFKIKFFREALLVKHLRYEKENEYRFLRKKDLQNPVSHIIPKRVIIGAHASDCDKNKIIDHCKKQGIEWLSYKPEIISVI